MNNSSFLDDDRTALLLDASVFINLYESSSGEEILSTIPNPVHVSEQVLLELCRDCGQGPGQREFIERALKLGLIGRLSLDDADAWQEYENLVIGPPSLGDGEAATIAIAAALSMLPVIDDRKARRVCEGKGISCARSLDLFLQRTVQELLTDGGLGEAVFMALRNGRMSIEEGRCEFVIALIGEEQALKCPCLPKYKELKRRLTSTKNESGRTLHLAHCR